MVLKHVHISLSLFCEPGNVLSITQNTKEGTVLVWFGLIWFGFLLGARQDTVDEIASFTVQTVKVLLAS